MSNSQEQSLDENVVFLPVTESSPEFLHCESERQAVERLVDEGPEAFYSSINTERSGCFLSPEEVRQLNSWAEDYRFSPLQVQKQANGDIHGPEVEDFHSTYFPSFSDTPTPNLELGWPDRKIWVPKGSIMVHTSPPAEGDPPVREIIRRHLQKARKVIAIVTDKLTDGAIIGDLHSAASRDVPVYIILNQRSIQENFTLNRLRHPHMRVRVLGGKTFCSRTGRMAVGEMKDKFILVDLETVILGSYSLTWTDAHLHRQLITVISGPVIDSFDREFRILFAASLAVPETGKVANTSVDVTHPVKTRPKFRLQKQKLPVDQEITSPPPPPSDFILDWEAMGVYQMGQCPPERPLDQREEIVAQEMPQQNNMLFDQNKPIKGGFIKSRNQTVEKKRVRENTSPVTNNVPDKTLNAKPSPKEPMTPESARRVERVIEKAISRQLSIEKSHTSADKMTQRVNDEAEEVTQKTVFPASTKRAERSTREPILEEEDSMNDTRAQVENKPSSRKPLILRVPQSESFSSLSDILRRLKTQPSTFRKELRGAGSEMSQSMMDLSTHNTDTNEAPPPRFKAGGFDPDQVTSSLALMKKRNDEFKPLLYRNPKGFMPRERPRSSSYALSFDWRKSLADKDG